MLINFTILYKSEGGKDIKFSFAIFATCSYFIYNFSKVSIIFNKPLFDILSIYILSNIYLIVI
jgi:hypothetical protein